MFADYGFWPFSSILLSISLASVFSTKYTRQLLHTGCSRLLTCIGLSSPVTLYHAEHITPQLKALLSQVSTLQDYYTPPLYLSFSHLPTIFSAFTDFSKIDKVVYERQYIKVPDGGTLSLDFAPSFAEAPIDDRPVLVLCHGLTGGSHESYVRSAVNEFKAKGWRCVVFQFRGCGQPATLTSAQLYSGAYTDDVRCGLLYLSHLLPKAPLYGVGFSLGANVITRVVGQDGSKTTLKAICPISNPWDFWKGHLELERSHMGMVYSRAMASNLRRIVKKYEHIFKDDPRLPWRCLFSHPRQSLYQFDNEFTARMGGYSSVEDYYLHASSSLVLHNVAIPLLAFHSECDPITSPRSIPFDVFKQNENIALAMTKHGGHLGWWEGAFAFKTKKRWIRKPIAEFLCAAHAQDSTPRPHPTSPARKATIGPQIGDDMVYDTENSNVGFQLVSKDSFVEGGQAESEKGFELKGL